MQEEVLGSFTPRVPQMRYAAFRARGVPIGSGIVESANKTVVAARLKGAGMRWSEAAINPMLARRGALCSDRWDETWTVVSHSRSRAVRRARVLSTPASTSTASAASVALPRRPKPQPPSAAIARFRPKTIIDGRPTSAHPWKRGLPCQSLPPAKL